MAEPLVIVGAGGFGREVLDVADAINAASTSPVWDIVGVIDDGPAQTNLDCLESRKVTFLGGVEESLTRKPFHFAVGIGAPAARRMITDRLEAAGHSSATLVHPSASQGFDVVIGAGSVICAGVRLTTNIRIGRHVHVNLNTTIGHDSVIGDFVSLNPLVSISGDCTIEDDVLVGVAGVVLNGLTVGQGSTVGGSACVVREVAAGVVVKGIPAR